MPAPKSFVAGDSVSFQVHDLAHPATEWALEYIISTATPTAVEATPDGEDFSVDISPEDSEDIAPGQYATFFVFTKADSRETVPDGRVLVVPNPTDPLPESFARSTLVECETAIKKLAKATNAVVSVNGETYTKTDVNKLLALRDRMIVEVAAEMAAYGRPARGAGKTIYTRFRN